MPRDLFGDVTRPSISIGSRKWYTLPLSLISHSAIVLAIVAIPILAPAVMPSVFADDDLTLITTVLPPPPPPPAIRKIDAAPPVANPGAAPVTAPTGIAKEQPLPEWSEPTSTSIITGGVGPGSESLVAPPPPVEAKRPEGPVRVGTFGVRTPVKTVDVRPSYPPIAQSARIQGIVIIEATISEDGHVINARIIRSVPLLDQAAIEAVRQWEFTPSLLNGRPVPVVMTVTVNFTLK